MEEHQRQLPVRAMVTGLQQRLCAQVSPWSQLHVRTMECELRQHLCTQVSPLITTTCQNNGLQQHPQVDLLVIIT